MNKLNALRAALLAAGLLALPAALAATMTKADYKAGKTRIRADYKADKSACAPGNRGTRARSCEPLLLEGFEIGDAALEWPTI